MYQVQGNQLIQKLKIVLRSNIFLILLIIIAVTVIIYKTSNVNSKYNINHEQIIGIITNIKDNDEKITLTIKAKENIIVYYSGNKKFNLGDKVKVVGKLEEIKSNSIFNLFNYKLYMLSKNTHYNIKTNNIITILLLVFRPDRMLNSIQSFLKEVFNEELVNIPELDLVTVIKDDLSPENEKNIILESLPNTLKNTLLIEMYKTYINDFSFLKVQKIENLLFK